MKTNLLMLVKNPLVQKLILREQEKIYEVKEKDI